VFATDTPLGPIKPTIDELGFLQLDRGEVQKITAGNAARLLKMNFK
jgi:predicted TIM-barrel fold metal-dependent hydrolase